MKMYIVDNFSPAIMGEYDIGRDRYVLKMLDGDGEMSIDGSRVRNVVKRLKEGHTFMTASPMYYLSRESAGYLLANAEDFLNKHVGDNNKVDAP